MSTPEHAQAEPCKHYRRRLHTDAFGLDFVTCIDCHQEGPHVPTPEYALAMAKQDGPWPPATDDTWLDGYNAALKELQDTIPHWRDYGVKPGVLENLEGLVLAVRDGWYCDDPTHTDPVCLERRPAGKAVAA